MKLFNNLIIACCSFLLLINFSCKKLEKFVTADQANVALKEALTQSNTSAKKACYEDQIFFFNSHIKLQMPVSNEVRTAIQSSIPASAEQMNQIDSTMNALSIQLSVVILPMMKTEIEKANFDNVYDLIKSKESLATNELQKIASDNLFLQLKPMVKQALAGTNAESEFNTIKADFNSIAGSNIIQVELADVLTTNLLKGYFYLMAQEEVNIRTQSTHQSTKLLQLVFKN